MESGKNDSKRVLIVDDAPINCIILSSLLSSNGVSSDIADSGMKCLELCEKNDYDLILLDHRMPDMDGVETFVKLKKLFLEKSREIPVVCHTTDDAKKNINLYKAAGFADVLIKPIVPEEVTQILMTYLPGSIKIDEEKVKEENEHIRLEEEKLPDWLKDIEGIDIQSGIEHCETAEDYLDALTVFASSIEHKSDEIENFLNESNLQMYTLRVHSLKSTSRLVGASEFADEAAFLELCGKESDLKTIKERTPALLTHYRAFLTKLSPLLEEEESPAHQGEVLPDISEATLNDAYSSISDFAHSYDAQSIRMVLDSLKEYRLSKEDDRHINDISTALFNADWKRIRNIIGGLV